MNRSKLFLRGALFLAIVALLVQPVAGLLVRHAQAAPGLPTIPVVNSQGITVQCTANIVLDTNYNQLAAAAGDQAFPWQWIDPGLGDGTIDNALNNDPAFKQLGIDLFNGNGNFIYIYLTPVLPGGATGIDSNAVTCLRGAFLFQDLSTSKFFGYSVRNGSSTYIESNFNATNKTITINGVATEPVDHGGAINNPSLGIPPGGGGGGGGGGVNTGPCFGLTGFPLAACMEPTFTDASHIVFHNETYELVAWNLDMKYVLKDTPSAARKTAFITTTGAPCVPSMLFDTDPGGGNGGVDYNLDSTNPGDREQFIAALASLGSGVPDINLRFLDCDLSGNPVVPERNLSDEGILRSTVGLTRFMRYFPKSGEIMFQFPAAGAFERIMIGTYTVSPTDPNVFVGPAAYPTECPVAPGLPTLTFVGGPPAPNATKNAVWRYPDKNTCALSNSATVSITGADAAAVATGTASVDPNATPLTQNAPVCESNGFSLSWLVCPMVNGLADLADTMFDKIIRPLLEFPTLDINPIKADGSPNPIFQVWNSMRFLGNLLLVVALLVIVFGQAVGGGLLDAYTVKKVLPRVLVSAILINISIYVVAVIIDVTNVLGKGLTDLIYSPFAANNNFVIHLNGGTSGLILVGTTGIIAAGLFLSGAMQMFLLFVLVPAALAFFGVIITLLIRLGIINLLIISGPVAFALYCIPNADKWAKKWFDLLVKTALVYPIIMTIFALSDILSWSINNANSDSNGALSTVGQLASVLLLVAPMFLIPFAFKLAGGAVASLYTAIGGFNKKTHGALKGSETDPYSRQNLAKRNFADSRLRARERAVQAGIGMQGKGPVRSKVGYQIARRLGGRNYEFQRARRNKEAIELTQNQTGTGGDNLVRAIFAKQLKYKDAQGRDQMGWFGTGAKLNAAGYVIDAHNANGIASKAGFADSEVASARELFGRDASAYQSALSYEMTKVGDDDEYGEMLARNVENFNTWADPLKKDAFTIQLGAGYAQQSERKEGKHLKLKTAGAGGATDVNGKHVAAGQAYYDIDHRLFSRDVAENIGTYQLANMKTSTPEQLRDSWHWSQSILSAGVGGADRDGHTINQETYDEAQEVAGYSVRIAQSLDGSRFSQPTQTPGGVQQTQAPPTVRAKDARINTGGRAETNDSINNFATEVLGDVDLATGERLGVNTFTPREKPVRTDPITGTPGTRNPLNRT